MTYARVYSPRFLWWKTGFCSYLWCLIDRLLGFGLSSSLAPTKAPTPLPTPLAYSRIAMSDFPSSTIDVPFFQGRPPLLVIPSVMWVLLFSYSTRFDRWPFDLTQCLHPFDQVLPLRGFWQQGANDTETETTPPWSLLFAVSLSFQAIPYVDQYTLLASVLLPVSSCNSWTSSQHCFCTFCARILHSLAEPLHRMLLGWLMRTSTSPK